MKRIIIVVLAIIPILTFAQVKPKAAVTSNSKIVLAVHGGAGTILKSQMTPEREQAYTAGITEALQKGYGILKAGGSSLDAVEAAVKTMEDNPLFNAGKGAVFTNEGRNELDAAIMDGSNLKAGSVAGITTIKNPITAARAVMEKSEHVMMVGKGAETFAAQNGSEVVDPKYFYTDDRFKGLQRAKAQDSTKALLDHNTPKQQALLKQPGNNDYKYGTVGSVARDLKGNLAAATSTGGMTNKKYGRVGDVPIIGAGTYANNNTCAISCTGWGEYFIRLVMAKSISDRMELAKMSLKQASDEMVMRKLGELGGDGGLIAVDKNGNIAMPFNTSGMYRGYIDAKGNIKVEIYK